MGLFSVVDVYLEGPNYYNGSFKDHFYFPQMLAICVTLMISAGYINAISIYGIFTYALTHMSGQTTGMAVKIVIGDHHMMITFFCNILSFGFGAFFAGVLVGGNKFTLGRHYAIGFIIQSIALYIVTFDLMFWSQYYAQFLIAFACGLQNGMTSTYSNNLCRTTHVTGMINDMFAIIANYIITKEKTDFWRIKVFLPLYLGFMVGGGIGVFLFKLIGVHAMWIPACFALFWGVLLLALRGIRDPSQARILDIPDLELLMI